MYFSYLKFDDKKMYFFSNFEPKSSNKESSQYSSIPFLNRD